MMNEDIAESRTEEFIQRFTPPEAIDESSCHSFLFDFEKYSFTPTSTQLAECLQAYLKLLEEATRERILGIFAHHNFMLTSELVLAYLIRAEAAQTLSIAEDTRSRLAGLTEKIVSEVRSFMGGRLDGDAISRVASINEYLRRDAPRNRELEITLKSKNIIEIEE